MADKIVNETLKTGAPTFSSIINSVPSIDNSSDFLRDMYVLRDKFFDSIFIEKILQENSHL